MSLPSSSRILSSLRSSTTHTLRKTLLRHLCRHRPRPIPQSSYRTYASRPPKSRDRGPRSSEDTQTDFAALNILASTPAPTTGIDACTTDGFHLDNNLKITDSGVLLVGGEAFRWRPWRRRDGTEKLQAEQGKGWEADSDAWGLLDVVWPKPDLLIVGTGSSIQPVSAATRKRINELGIRLEVADTRNAAAQFNLLATERGVQQVAAALVPIGWKEKQ
ncbi:hypothetical protein M501DRAFT_929973 [Patellaria atrata CBS 101060]|uniref:NADH dehydrogenase [ubiquinone] 1 alpha subcomplex assembly factor 3 n=1 Tax=Patellaria atrata CBS 101060 TaxID=1346257 RepID=A0A9P4VPI7_9PEZI|nr:hypothetical protein M501DRAFT_929973 [Patellaria atrata CBS 101060]